MTDTIDTIKAKIVSRSDYLKSAGRNPKLKVVFTNGVFDILHKGHIELLARAADFGDILIVGLNSDQSVKRLKGENRPLQDEESRALVLASIEFVDYVIRFTEDTPLELIKSLHPNVLIKGGDYKVEEIVGYDFVKETGGEVYCLEFVKGYSSTSIIGKIN